MGLYRDENGLTFELNDQFALNQGYTPVSPEEAHQVYAAEGAKQAENERGLAGTATAFGTQALSGATLGLSDVGLAHILDPSEREQIAADISAHPYAATAGAVAGSLAGAVAAPESLLARTPAGYLGSMAMRASEEGLARGGIAGTAKAIAAFGAEGAAQSAGQYIGAAAIEDKDLTAEGLAGAASAGFTFGALGGGAALGISKGAISVRKLIAPALEGGEEAAVAAKQGWSTASQAQLEADTATADIAKSRLEELRIAKAEALKYQQQSKSMVAEEKLRASAAGPTPKFVPEPSPPMTTEGGTQIISRERAPIPETGTPIPESGMRPSEMASGTETQVIPGMKQGAGESVTPDFGTPGRPARPRPPEDTGAAAELALQGGQDIAAGRARSGENSIKGWLDDIAEHDAVAKPLSAHGPGRTSLEAKLEESLSEMRKAKTTELLGKQTAVQEQNLTDALHEFEDAKADFVKLTSGGDLGTGPEGTAVGKRSRGVEILDRTHGEALRGAQTGATAQERGAALMDADHLEQLLTKMQAPRVQSDRGVFGGVMDFADEIHGGAKIIDRYEKAQAKLVETVGDAAHPMSQEAAKAYTAAADDAVRKTTDRVTRAVEDHETFGPFERVGPEYKTPKDRVYYARERKIEADKAVYETKNAHAEGQRTYSEAAKKVKAGEKAKAAATVEAAKAAPAAPGLGSKLANLGSANELFDLPGMPKIHDLPVVGPILGAWLKYRLFAQKAGMLGKVAASADTRVAALAARTKNRMAVAIDRSLGVIGKGGKYASRYVPQTAGILATRIYDDGGANPPKGAGIQEHAAARVRELAAYVTTPDAIENDVRRELRGVTDPDLITAVEKQRRAMMEYLLSKAPQQPDQSPLAMTKWLPSGAESMSFARRWEAAHDPAGVFERLSEARGMIGLEASETLRDVYPKLFALGQMHVAQKATEIKETVPYRNRVMMSMLYQLPLDPSMDADNLKITQSVYERIPAQPPAGPVQSPPVPGVAQPTNINQMFTPSLDRQR